ncbi:hypothetical protein ACHAPM_004309 [Fusarium culmorum]
MDDDGALPSPLYSESHQKQTASWLGTLPLIELFLMQMSTASLLRRKRISNLDSELWLALASARTKKNRATSNKRLHDGDENNEDGEDSEDSERLNQQLSKRPRTYGETGARHQQPFLTVYRYNGVQNDEHH